MGAACDVGDGRGRGLVEQVEVGFACAVHGGGAADAGLVEHVDFAAQCGKVSDKVVVHAGSGAEYAGGGELGAHELVVEVGGLDASLAQLFGVSAHGGAAALLNVVFGDHA